MTDTTIIEMPTPVEGGARTPFSWSAAIAGAIAAAAVTFIIAALGSGIGLPFASPYSSGLSATGLTVAAAVWLVMAQAIGFATGGYLAGRLRSPAYDGVIGERTFRDAAEGFMVWAIGVVAMIALAGLIGLYTAGVTAQVASGLISGFASNPSADSAGSASAKTGASSVDYFVDAMFRPAAGSAVAGGQRPANGEATTVGSAAPSAPPALNAEARAEVTRILARSVAQGRFDESDKAYLAQLVSARTGLPPDEAQRRVTDIETKARESAKETVDKAAKSGAYLAFWTFMSLLFGATAATLAGMLGGQLRDAEGRTA
jgi:hypothetical protein